MSTTTLDVSTDSAVSDLEHSGIASIRVLHLINGEHYAGAERVQDLLAQRLPDFGVEVGFACLKPLKFPAARHARKAPLSSFPMHSRFDVLKPVREVARLIRQENYALLHTHTPRTAMIGRLASWLAGVPMVHHVHSHTSTEVNARWRQRLGALAERICLRGASRVIAVSESSGDYICRQGIAEDAISIVFNGIPIPEMPAKRPTPQGEWTLGTVGLFRPRKGLEVLLRAMAILKQRSVSIRLRAVGPFETPQYKVKIQRLAAELGLSGEIQWRGFRSDVLGELAAMDLFIFPSVLPEGMPMVVLEAMASGTPIVGTRVAGMTDVIRDGQDGLLVSPGDHDSLADAVYQIMSDETTRQALRTSALDRQATQFSDRTMAAGVARVYRQVLGR